MAGLVPAIHGFAAIRSPDEAQRNPGTPPRLILRSGRKAASRRMGGQAFTLPLLGRVDREAVGVGIDAPKWFVEKANEAS